MKKLFLLLVFAIIFSTAYSQKVGDNPGITAKVLQSTSSLIKIQYDFGGFYNEEIKINGKLYANINSPGLTSIMEKGNPQIPTYINSVVIPDYAMMNWRIISLDYYEVSTNPVMPSKGHFTRDIDPNSIPYTFNDIYNQNTWFPANIIDLKEPYVVRDLRGLTVQFNPVQYNPQKGILRIYRKLTIELYQDNSKQVVNPIARLNPFKGVTADFIPVYRNIFLNYGIDGSKYDSIAEPGKMLIICPATYLNSIAQFVQWKKSRGLDVTVAEYPATTGSGNTAIKTYIQNMYNSPGSLTYIILVGDNSDIPTMNGTYENAPSDPCYVKLSGNDAYPDAFISRISCQNASSVYYVTKKFIKFERDIVPGLPWYNKGIGIGGRDIGGTPSYSDSTRMDWIRDTLLANGFSQFDRINGPKANPQDLIGLINRDRFIIEYVGHGSGTSWSNTGFSVSSAYQLSNGWENPFLIDVACLNGNFTLNECLAEALLRAGDTANPKGCSDIYASSTNASWVPPCDMQTEATRIFAHQYRKSAGAIMFFGVMKAMDLWGGSTGEGLKLMEQYNIFGDCSLLLTRGSLLTPYVSHITLKNTENLTGPYTVNCIITPGKYPLKSGMTKLYWTRGIGYNDSTVMTNTSGNNWTANIPGNGNPAIYKYYIKSSDSTGMNGTCPFDSPVNYFSFSACADTIKPAITHSSPGFIPKIVWPSSVSAVCTDNIGVDSVWVRWYILETPSNIRHFRLNNSSGNNYSGIFNSVNSEVNFNNVIKYRIFAKDNSLAHNVDSSDLYQVTITDQNSVVIGTGTSQSNFPFTTYWTDGRTQMLYLSSEFRSSQINNSVNISKIGFKIISADTGVMNNFNVRMQNYSERELNQFITSGWTNCFSGTYRILDTGWRYIDLETPFPWDGISNILIEICYDNNLFRQYSPVYATPVENRIWGNCIDNNTGCTLPGGSALLNRPNISLVFSNSVIINGNTNTIPLDFSLSQNYPNPFNPVTRINFGVPKQGFVSIKIYDILGREVKTLVNEVKSPGMYSVDFNGIELSSGVYFYRMESNGFMDIKRMVLIK